ncbi:MAG: serine hydrolase [Clostridia bacterium]|nr:serine hydrolase [Clostridia bacterium]
MICEVSWNQRLKALPGTIGVYVKDLENGEMYTYAPDAEVIAASVIKLFIMAEVFAQKEEGLLRLEETHVLKEKERLPSCGALKAMHTGVVVTIGDLVHLMITLSDNTATNILIERLGIERIQERIDQMGLSHTHIRRMLFQPELSKQGIENTLTAADCGVFLEALYRGKVISPSASADMLKILFDQRLNGKMPFFLHSQGIACAHKTGEDDGITHDVGLIQAAHPLVFCFLSEKTDVPQAERLLQDMAREMAQINA